MLYEDSAVVVLDKPAGLAAVPVKGSDAPSALSLLAAKLKAKRERAYVVHRIDRFTSGILLFAKTEADRDKLVRQFLEHTPGREYLAVVRGRVVSREGTLVHYLTRVGMYQKLRAENDAEAARAELRYCVERPLRGASLVRVTLVSGLQNQIRVQFSAIGHPVIGTENTTRRSRRSGESPAWRCMRRDCGLCIRARGKSCRSTVNLLRTFSHSFERYRPPLARAGELRLFGSQRGSDAVDVVGAIRVLRVDRFGFDLGGVLQKKSFS